MKRFPILGLAMALVSANLLTGCDDGNLADIFNSTATVTYSDGVTPFPNFSAASYEVMFSLNDNSTIARTYTNKATPTPPPGFGVLSDGAGNFNVKVADADLYKWVDDVDCYDTCVSWDYTCDYDPYWDEYDCYDYCTWYTTDCYDSDYTTNVNVGAIKSTTTYLNYVSGSSAIRSQGITVSESADLAANAWNRTEKFVTPFTAPATEGSEAAEAAPAKGKKTRILVDEKAQVKRTSCEEQGDLSEEKMDKVRALRKTLGVSEANVRCRK